LPIEREDPEDRYYFIDKPPTPEFKPKERGLDVGS
jgi:hypothetical protein